MERCGATRGRGADAGRGSGKGGNEFRGITVNNSVAGVLTGPDTNFKHMSQEVQNKKEEGTLANPNAVSGVGPSEMVVKT